MPDPSPQTITVIALETRNLDTTCYRGSAALADLARLSQADVFDQVLNPEGLQRELSMKHAAEAYAYAAADPDPKLPRAFPEVMLNVRDRKVVKAEKLGDGRVELTFDVGKILAARSVKVSRMDGNHRLVLAGGDGKDRPPLEAHAPFQLHIGLTPEQEASMFKDVNANQKGMNTSHLDVLRARLTPEEIELQQHPEIVFATKLANDVASPWNQKVHMGGSKQGLKAEGITTLVTLKALESGIKRMLSKSGYLKERDPEGQYGLIRSYWQAVAAVFPEAFESPREYLVAKNLGVNVFSALGAEVIDKCIIAGAVEIGNMVPFLEAAKPVVDWHKDSKDTAGMSGNRAINLLVGRMSKTLPRTAETYKDPAAAEKEQRAA